MVLVLYVDDDPALLDIGKTFLELSGRIQIHTVSSVSEALEEIKRRDYDGVITDYEMPHINGIAFLRYIREHYRDLPVVLFTGRSREEIAIEALNSGADFYLQKGGNPKPQFAELEYNLLHAIERRKAQEELRESRQLMANLIDFLPDATFAINRENVVISWNRMMEKITGISAGDIMGRATYREALARFNEQRIPLIDIVLDPGRDVPGIQLIRDGNAIISEFYSPGAYGGKGAYLWLIASPLYDAGGNAIGAIESIRDVSKRMEAEKNLQKTHVELNAAYEQLAATEEELRQNYNELAKSEEKIHKSEERYRNIVEDQTELICRFSPAGLLTFVNGAYCRYFGLDPAKCIGKLHPVRIPKEDKTCMEEHFAAFSREQPVAAIEHRIVMPDGKVRWQRWSDRAVFDENGRIVEYQSVGRDTSDQHEAFDKLTRTNTELSAAYEQLAATEEELRQNYDELSKSQHDLHESQERYRNIVEDQTEFICRFSPAGLLTFVNGAYCRYFGLDPAACIGKPHPVKIPAEDQKTMKAHLAEFTPESPVHTIEHRIVMPDGKVRWQRWSDRAVFDKEGRIVEYQSVGRDTTDQHGMIEQLTRTNTELSAAYEQLAATEEELRQNYDELAKSQRDLRESQERYRNIVEDQTEFISRFRPDGTHLFVNEAYCRYFGKTREEIVGHRFVPDIPKDDRTLLAAHFAAVTPENPVHTVEHRILMPNGEVRWQQWSDRAIFGPDGKVAEYQSVGRDITDRKCTEQALSEANRKLTLLSGITRHDILNQLTALQGYLGLIQTTAADPAVKGLAKQALHTGEIIHDQISFTRQYESIGTQMPVWQNVYETAAGVSRDGGFRLVTVDPALKGIEIYADPLLKLIFYNLFENSWMHAGRDVKVRVSGTMTENGAEIVVSDTGRGVPLQEKEKIFQKGYGTHTGLGLYLVREILSITTISIREDGEPGAGARFTIQVPVGMVRKEPV
ncbi:PAS domain S-box protein [Methanoregula sp. UBA64]|uniref:response regulator n=1 Tax=Methanoregula sp. UBA64 TaxID=1915554 RepID=UPI0025ED0408|nr:PAS domain S-box protein [Methanoregula sp. UBA64]